MVMIYRQPFCQGVKKSSLQLVAKLVEIFSKGVFIFVGNIEVFCTLDLHVHSLSSESTSNVALKS